VIEEKIRVFTTVRSMPGQNSVRVVEPAMQGVGIGIQKELARVETLAPARIERAFRVQPVQPSRFQIRDETLKNMAVAGRQGEHVHRIGFALPEQGDMNATRVP
jgi:hypothetical protein